MEKFHFFAAFWSVCNKITSQSVKFAVFIRKSGKSNIKKDFCRAVITKCQTKQTKTKQNRLGFRVVHRLEYSVARHQLSFHSDIHKASLPFGIRNLLTLRQPYGNFHGADHLSDVGKRYIPRICKIWRGEPRKIFILCTRCAVLNKRTFHFDFCRNRKQAERGDLAWHEPDADTDFADFSFRNRGVFPCKMPLRRKISDRG